MLALPDEEISYWKHDYLEPTYEPFRDAMEVDTIIVGAGITGLTCAYLLKQAGRKVAVLEKSTVGGGTTGRTTGKVTSQHNLMYDDLRQRLGEKIAQSYGEANQAALHCIDQIIKKEKITCGWQREDNYVFTNDATKIKRFKQEAETAARLGLPATFETDIPLPFDIKAAVKFSDQGKLHPLQYLRGLAKAIHGGGSFIFEQSPATRIKDGTPCIVRSNGARIIAKDIIVATNVPTFPLLARGSYCALEYPEISYIVAGRLPDSLSGMYISPDKQHYSILPVMNGDIRLLLIGGEGHISGVGGSKEKRYKKLADYAERTFGISKLEYRWADRDYLAYDSIPLIGKMYPWSNHLYVGTAFKKWGLSGGTVAGLLLCDQICGHKNKWAQTFDSTRLKPVASIPRVAAQKLGI